MNRLTKYAIVKYSGILKAMNASNLEETAENIEALSKLIGPDIESKVVNIVLSKEI